MVGKVEAPRFALASSRAWGTNMAERLRHNAGYEFRLPSHRYLRSFKEFSLLFPYCVSFLFGHKRLKQISAKILNT